MTGNYNMWLDGIMGVVIGDALGCPVQFESRKEVAKHPVTGMRGYGTFNLPEGSWTDDSSLTLALLESIRRLGRIDLDDIMENFMKWLYDGEFTPYGYSYDVGRGTMLAIGRYKKNRKAKKCGGDEEWNNGNGSLMRILPVCIYSSGKLRRGDLTEHDAIQAVHSVGGLTHAHIRSNIACGLYFFMVDEVLNAEGSLRERCYDRLQDLDAFATLPADRIKSTGYVVDALEAAVWSLATTGSFEEALLKAVNLGDDTDTVGAIAGGLAGLYYGYDKIPADWLAAIKRRDWIEELCDMA